MKVLKLQEISGQSGALYFRGGGKNLDEQRVSLCGMHYLLIYSGHSLNMIENIVVLNNSKA